MLFKVIKSCVCLPIDFQLQNIFLELFMWSIGHGLPISVMYIEVRLPTSESLQTLRKWDLHWELLLF